MDYDSDDKTMLQVPPPSTDSKPRARLICLDDMLVEDLHGLEIELTDQDQSIGRDESNSIRINFKKLSRKHAKISYSNGVWEIEDLNSANGVFLNEERIQRTRLGHGDILLIGQIPFRFEVDALKNPLSNQPESPSDYVGESGTMYAQHVGVIQSLAAAQDAPAEEPEQPTELGGRPVSEAPVINRVQAVRKGRALNRAIVISVTLAVLVAGAYFYGQYRDTQSVIELINSYKSDVAGFIEDYESTSGPNATQSLEIELGEIRKITARVDLALQQHPDTAELLELRAKLLFLEFERYFDNLLLGGRIYEAEQLIAKNRSELLAFAGPAAGAQSDPIRYTSDLLDLAQVVVKFERFKQSYPDPADATAPRPDEYTLGKMRETKDELIAKKRVSYQMLSVVYLRFQQLLSRIEEQNVRLLNRWNELVKRETGTGV